MRQRIAAVMQFRPAALLLAVALGAGACTYTHEFYGFATLEPKPQRGPMRANFSLYPSFGERGEPHVQRNPYSAWVFLYGPDSILKTVEVDSFAITGASDSIRRVVVPEFPIRREDHPRGSWMAGNNDVRLPFQDYDVVVYLSDRAAGNALAGPITFRMERFYRKERRQSCFICV